MWESPVTSAPTSVKFSVSRSLLPHPACSPKPGCYSSGNVLYITFTMPSSPRCPWAYRHGRPLTAASWSAGSVLTHGPLSRPPPSPAKPHPDQTSAHTLSPPSVPPASAIPPEGNNTQVLLCSKPRADSGSFLVLIALFSLHPTSEVSSPQR